MDPRFGAAWVAFGHSFALENEHEHAITAYSTCARMFAGYVVLICTHRHMLNGLLSQLTSAIAVCWHGTHHIVELCIG